MPWERNYRDIQRATGNPIFTCLVKIRANPALSTSSFFVDILAGAQATGPRRRGTSWGAALSTSLLGVSFKHGAPEMASVCELDVGRRLCSGRLGLS